MTFPLVSTLGSAGIRFACTVPAVVTTAFSTTGGRESVYKLVVPLMQLFGPKNAKSDYFIASAIAAGGIIDIHWLAQIFSLFTTRVGGFFRENVYNVEAGAYEEKIYEIAKEYYEEISSREGAALLVSKVQGYTIQEDNASERFIVLKDAQGGQPVTPISLNNWADVLVNEVPGYAFKVAQNGAVQLFKVTLDQKVEVAKDSVEAADGTLLSVGWLAHERAKQCKITKGEDGADLQRPQIGIYYDVNHVGKKEMPKRAGITPFAYYWTYNKVKAFVLINFAWSSFQSVASTYVPLLKPDISLFSSFTKIVCRMGGEQICTPQQWDSGFRLFWKKADTIALSTAYALQAFDAGRRLWNINDDLGRSRIKEATKLGANLTLTGLYAWMTLTGENSPYARMTAGALQLFLITTKELRKASIAEERKSSRPR